MEVTVQLLENAMVADVNGDKKEGRFLIDGKSGPFPLLSSFRFFSLGKRGADHRRPRDRLPAQNGPSAEIRVERMPVGVQPVLRLSRGRVAGAAAEPGQDVGAGGR